MFQASFQLGWNSLLAGFSGVYRYASITDFEYLYKIHTPIEGFQENGIVVKIILYDGLDFEVSAKLGEKQVCSTFLKVYSIQGVPPRLSVIRLWHLIFTGRPRPAVQD